MLFFLIKWSRGLWTPRLVPELDMHLTMHPALPKVKNKEICVCTLLLFNFIDNSWFSIMNCPCFFPLLSLALLWDLNNSLHSIYLVFNTVQIFNFALWSKSVSVIFEEPNSNMIWHWCIIIKGLKITHPNSVLFVIIWIFQFL